MRGAGAVTGVGDQAQFKAAAKNIGFTNVLAGCDYAALRQNAVDIGAPDAAEGYFASFKLAHDRLLPAGQIAQVRMG